MGAELHFIGTGAQDTLVLVIPFPFCVPDPFIFLVLLY